MISIPPDMGPQEELAVRRAFDFALGRLIEQDAPASALKLFSVVFCLRHHLRPALEGGDSVPSFAAAINLSEDSASRALGWLTEHDFIFFGRKGGGQLRSAVMLRPLYLSNVQAVFHRDIPKKSTARRTPASVRGSALQRTPRRTSYGSETVGAYSDTGRSSARNPNGERRKDWRLDKAGDLIRGTLAALAPPGMS